MVNANEVAHLYVGSKAIFSKSGRIITVFAYDDERGWYDGGYRWPADIWNFKLLLRPLSSLTDAEKCELYRLGKYFDHCSNESGMTCEIDRSIMSNLWTPAQTLYLLKKSIDIFGLIDSKQAELL